MTVGVIAAIVAFLAATGPGNGWKWSRVWGDSERSGWRWLFLQSLGVTLLVSVGALAVALVLGFAGIRLARSARTRLERTLGRAGGAVPARLGRVFSWIAVYFALIGAISLGVYAIEYYELLS